jgi:hypothetical protein
VVRKAGVRVTDAEKQTGKSNEIPRLLKNLKKKKELQNSYVGFGR